MNETPQPRAQAGTPGPNGPERVDAGVFARGAYLDYAMYVVRDRAVPHVGDGLKPVQRRLLHAMAELGLRARPGRPAPRYKKSARTVGDTLGKYHPHGDSACYEAMVHLAQGFATRHPLVDGQGNWGAQDDPRSFAAMRYTEARLSPYAETLLDELDRDTVAWRANFDGTVREPTVLPARVPNLLVNGAEGIGVGLSTDVPPHCLAEVGEAAARMVEDPGIDDDALLALVAGPDYPTGGVVTSAREEIEAAYRTGSGQLRLRARFERETPTSLVVTELPYQVSTTEVLEQLGARLEQGALREVEDLRDESDEASPVRLVVELKRARARTDEVVRALGEASSLARTVRVNLTALGLDGRPRNFTLRELLEQWTAFRRRVVERRIAHRLRQVRERLHAIAALRAAHANLDRLVRILREPGDPKTAIERDLGLDEAQVEIVLGARVRALARLNDERLGAEETELRAERDALEATAASPSRTARLIAREIRAAVNEAAPVRRTTFSPETPGTNGSKGTDPVADEPVTVVLSRDGFARAAKGHDVKPQGLGYRDGDGYKAHAHARSTDPAVFVDTTGRTYALRAGDLPGARGWGEPLTARWSPPAGATFEHVVSAPAHTPVLLVSSVGYGFVSTVGDLATRQKTGKASWTLPDGAHALLATALEEDRTHLALETSRGYLLVVAIGEVPRQARGKGNRLVAIPAARRGEPEHVVCATVLRTHDALAAAGASLAPEAWRRHVGPTGRRGKRPGR